MLDELQPLKIVDIGCGAGSSTLLLAEKLNAEITAVDFLSDFIDILNEKAESAGLSDKINTLICSMDDLPFDNEKYDVIWSEGDVYNIGFENGITYWKQFLKPGGILAVSEITWLTEKRPAELEEYWSAEYPEMATADEKISILEKAGYSPIGYFVLPQHCWLENFYHPLQKTFDNFLKRNNNSKEAEELLEAQKEEIALYEKYKEFYSYGFYAGKNRIIMT
ncbi:MAG: SAM-dependent methyltransferase [Planctomycetota bacterium]|jgi:ubiquinone/menaquinone biosynthesis C-methylase UbiE